ncbi:MAG TPA: hypothetical protein VG225_08455 [Terracidiphilus sp.]|nr:hypothetical protein [Terracidiphilus sp.]
MAIIIAFVVVIGLLFAASWMFHEKQEARMTLHKYGDALVAKDYAKAYSLRDSELQKRLTEPEFERSHELAESRYGRLKEVIIESGEKVGDQNGMTVTMISRVVYENAEDRFAVTMKKEGDSWFIKDYRFKEK